MKQAPNAFENQIFHHFRESERKEQEAIAFLKAKGYKIIKTEKIEKVL